MSTESGHVTPAAASSVATTDDRPRPASDVLNLVRGFCMGAADTVPGVSGGTVALVLGHYQRLLTAINSFNTTALSLFRAGRWAELWKYCDLRFLLALGIGIVGGAGSLATSMHWLLEHRMPETYAMFFGLILISGWIVGRSVRHWTPTAALALVAGTLLAYGIALLPVGQASDYGPYLFFTATIAICAMILPGISGAFVLLVLGTYHPVMGMIKQFVHGEISIGLITNLTLFASGCLVGLAAFSRLLHWLLRVHTDVTMAALVGLMVGSLRKIWPLQQATDATVNLPFKEQQFRVVSLSEWDGNRLTLVGLATVAVAVVWIIERIASQAAQSDPVTPDRSLS
jgi:putative membrane protein